MKRAFMLVCAIAASAFVNAHAQLPLFELPRISPAASTSQRIGLTDITVRYHRPGVKGREVWGAVVPWGQVWRAGANENTTVTFSSPVMVGGRALDAGTYGLHMIPTQPYWTVILSYENAAWGSFSYDESEDAVRVTVTAAPAPHQERLLYTFDDLTDDSCMLTLHWAELKISFRIEIDVNAVVVEQLRTGLRGLPRFTWRGWQQAALWCVQHNVNLDEAMGWIDRSIRMNSNFTNMRTKAALLEKQGAARESRLLMDTAFGVATEAEMSVYGYQLLGEGKLDEAIVIFTRIVEDHPDSWNAYDSLAEAHASKGNKSAAVRNYEKALTIVDDEQQKRRIETILARLK